MGALQYLVSCYMLIKYLEVEQFQVSFCWLQTSATTNSYFYSSPSCSQKKQRGSNNKNNNKNQSPNLWFSVPPLCLLSLLSPPFRRMSIRELELFRFYKTELPKDPSKISSKFYVKDYGYPWLILWYPSWRSAVLSHHLELEQSSASDWLWTQPKQNSVLTA